MISKLISLLISEKISNRFKDLSDWQFVSNQSDPYIYESPKMFRHGGDIYLVARNDLDGTFQSDPIIPFKNETRHHAVDLAAYSLRRHG